MSALAPGDLAVVIATPEDGPIARSSGLYGKVVVLIEICGHEHTLTEIQRFLPTWRCSGLPGEWHCVSHISLRKIPPAPLEIDLVEDFADRIPTLTEVAG